MVMPSWLFDCRDLLILLIVLIDSSSFRCPHVVVSKSRSRRRHTDLIVRLLSYSRCDAVIFTMCFCHRHHSNNATPLSSYHSRHTAFVDPSMTVGAGRSFRGGQTYTQSGVNYERLLRRWNRVNLISFHQYASSTLNHRNICFAVVMSEI